MPCHPSHAQSLKLLFYKKKFTLILIYFVVIFPFTGNCDGISVFTYLHVIYFNCLHTIIIVLSSTKLKY